LEVDILNVILCPLETFPAFSELIQILKTSCPAGTVGLCLELKKVKLKVGLHYTRWTAYPGDTKWSKNEKEKEKEIGKGN